MADFFIPLCLKGKLMLSFEKLLKSQTRVAFHTDQTSSLAPHPHLHSIQSVIKASLFSLQSRLRICLLLSFLWPNAPSHIHFLPGFLHKHTPSLHSPSCTCCTIHTSSLPNGTRTHTGHRVSWPAIGRKS